ncbi:hypothetical protein [Polymorphum gilvum]|uniref:Uncharacterized protein n=1 Tax=Polymorphum gilvum (strain LMG 25793 / CGMCC 1.9160 / SL003B-26A1) TaxID=991905 RepID=F2J5L3_POLGS|nr:hypothetical protein [Polymorphum gilvum]ADZ70097.1 hypothetical protein SL003B_1669 [Polymorphum gilvum SL003B-26A1]
MIYAVGHRDTYETALDRSQVMKMGKREVFKGVPYAGCAVWRTAAEAREYLLRTGYDTYEVYGVVASWELHTEQIDGEPFRRLLHDCLLLRIGSERS